MLFLSKERIRNRNSFFLCKYVFIKVVKMWTKCNVYFCKHRHEMCICNAVFLYSKTGKQYVDSEYSKRKKTVWKVNIGL